MILNLRVECRKLLLDVLNNRRCRRGRRVVGWCSRGRGLFAKSRHGGFRTRCAWALFPGSAAVYRYLPSLESLDRSGLSNLDAQGRSFHPRFLSPSVTPSKRKGILTQCGCPTQSNTAYSSNRSKIAHVNAESPTSTYFGNILLR